VSNYIALIRKEKRSDFGVSFPDFAGCVTAGRTLDEARQFAEEALSLHIEGLLAEGESIPAPSTLETIMAASENLDAVAFLVSVTPAESRSVRVNVTLPESVLQRIDACAEGEKESRSAFLADAALRRIEAIANSRSGPASKSSKARRKRARSKKTTRRSARSAKRRA